jgi:hypothetical protein
MTNMLRCAALAVTAPARVQRFPLNLATLAILLTVLGSPLAAQLDPPLHPGDRIRVTHACDAGASQGSQSSLRCRRDVGRAVAIGDALVLHMGSQRTEIPSESITLIERSVSRRRHTVLGAGVGFLAGVVLGAVAPCQGGDSQEGVCRAVSVIGLGGVGLIAGSVIGWTSRSDNWVPITASATRPAAAHLPTTRSIFSLKLRIPVP